MITDKHIADAERLLFLHKKLENQIVEWVFDDTDQTCTLCHKFKRENLTYDPEMNTIAWLCQECYEKYEATGR